VAAGVPALGAPGTRGPQGTPSPRPPPPPPPLGPTPGPLRPLPPSPTDSKRRHQKVLEETPSPLVTPELRKALCGAATALGASANYRSAGTVEFLVDEGTNQFYFLEVNTRLQVGGRSSRDACSSRAAAPATCAAAGSSWRGPLAAGWPRAGPQRAGPHAPPAAAGAVQVEHGITEMVHGNVDIVEWQLRLQVPGLDRLDLSREMPLAQGCAIEVRRRPRPAPLTALPPLLPSRPPPACAARHAARGRCASARHAVRTRTAMHASSLPQRPAPAAAPGPAHCAGAHQRRGPQQGLHALPWPAGRGGLPRRGGRRARRHLGGDGLRDLALLRLAAGQAHGVRAHQVWAGGRGRGSGAGRGGGGKGAGGRWRTRWLPGARRWARRCWRVCRLGRRQRAGVADLTQLSDRCTPGAPPASARRPAPSGAR
jgi:hypothetical protein